MKKKSEIYHVYQKTMDNNNYINLQCPYCNFLKEINITEKKIPKKGRYNCIDCKEIVYYTLNHRTDFRCDKINVPVEIVYPYEKNIEAIIFGETIEVSKSGLSLKLRESQEIPNLEINEICGASIYPTGKIHTKLAKTRDENPYIIYNKDKFFKKSIIRSYNLELKRVGLQFLDDPKDAANEEFNKWVASFTGIWG